MRFGELSVVEARIIAMYRKAKRKDVFLSVMESVVSVDEEMAVNNALQSRRRQGADSTQSKIIDFQCMTAIREHREV